MEVPTCPDLLSWAMYLSNQYLSVLLCFAASLLKKASSKATNEKGEIFDSTFSALASISCKPFFIFFNSSSRRLLLLIFSHSAGVAWYLVAYLFLLGRW